MRAPAAALRAALTLLPVLGAAQPTEPAGAPSPSLPGPIRPILLGSIGTDDRGGLGLAFDLGLRVAPALVRWDHRLSFVSGGSLTYSSARVGWIFAENAWAAGWAGAGAGRLTYAYDRPGPRVAVTAFSVEAGIALGARCGLGPVLGVRVEALAPAPRPPDPRNGTLAAPSFHASLDLNVLALALRWAPLVCP